jgi:hypothetical protein
MDIKTTINDLPSSWRSKVIWALVFIFVAVVSYFIGLKWEGYRNQARIDALQAAYQQEQDKLIALSQDRASALILAAKTAKSLDLLQRNDDIRIKEAGKSAYKQKMAIPDTDIDNAWHDFMSGVRERNNQRQ